MNIKFRGYEITKGVRIDDESSSYSYLDGKYSSTISDKYNELGNEFRVFYYIKNPGYKPAIVEKIWGDYCLASIFFMFMFFPILLFSRLQSKYGIAIGILLGVNLIMRDAGFIVAGYIFDLITKML